MRNTIRQIYFYAATLIFLIMSVISLISLINLVLKTYVFTKADMGYAMPCDPAFKNYPEPNPVMPDGSEVLPAPRTPGQIEAATAACEESQKEQKSAARQNELVQNLSMLLVAAPLFWLHFRWVQKEREIEVALAKDEKKV